MSRPVPRTLCGSVGLWPLPLLLLLLLLLASCTGTRDAKLRLRKVVLYQNGIGYFEHSGQAQKDKLQISVRRSELDDALKTLTIVSQSSDGVTPRHGTVHTMTGDEAAAKNDRSDDQRAISMVVQLPEARKDELRVSYAVPTPIWKATYRVVLDEQKEREVLLQGWAAIQNTSGHDWHNVKLTLATGAPLSFGVNLTRPTYSARPDLAGRMHTPVAVGAVRATSTRPGDEDGDGILDSDDLCPGDGEDFDQFEDDDGCPDPDNDHDRILDVDDQCPLDGETYNGIEDDDGCPDRGRVIVTDSNLSILDKVYFADKSSEVRAVSHPILDAIAATLQGNLDIAEVEVQGHAAGNESDAWSRAEDRAIAVASYLVQAGVDRKRLRMESYGASMPLTTRSDAEAHAKNRRVEFLILRRHEDHARDTSRAVSKTDAPPRTLPKRPGASMPSLRASGGMVHYKLPSAVSIANGESSLVPLINANVEGEEIYLFRPDKNLPGSDQHPSRAVRVVNTGDLALVPGPIAVFARDAFAGEGLLGALHPKESAFIPFSLDRSALVSSEESEKVQAKGILSIVEASIVVTDDHQLTTEYTLSAGLTPPTRAFVQHQIRTGYELESPVGAEFNGAIVLAPMRLSGAAKTTLRLREKREGVRTLSLQDGSVEEIGNYMEVATLPGPTSTALARVLDLRISIQLGNDTLDAKRSQRFDSRIRAYEIRKNLKALARDQGTLRASLKSELAESEKRARLLASELAVLSEALAKERIELKSLLLSLKYKALKK